MLSNVSTFIAVVDDEEPVRTALRRLLQSAGLTVKTFSGGGEFLATLGIRRPDCVVLDMHMPDVTGLEVLARLAEAGTGVPVVILTGQDSSDLEESAMRSGATAFLRKPIKDRLLLDTISAAIARSTPG